MTFVLGLAKSGKVDARKESGQGRGEDQERPSLIPGPGTLRDACLEIEIERGRPEQQVPDQTLTFSLNPISESNNSNEHE